MKSTNINIADYLGNMLLPGLGFRNTLNNKHVASYFYLMTVIIVILGAMFKRDLWSVGMYLVIGLVANISLLVCAKEEQKACLVVQSNEFETEPLEGDVEIVKPVKKAHVGLIILIFIMLPMLFSYVYTNTPEGTNWWKESSEAKTYLTKMYGDHFTIERVEFVRSLLYSEVVSVVYFHPNERPGKQFKANRAIGGAFDDTYVSYALSEDARSIIDGPIKDAFGEDVVYILESAPSDALRYNYDPSHDGNFAEYINKFSKHYKPDDDGVHLETEISVLRFMDYEKTDMDDEAKRVIRLGKTFESMNLPVLQIKLQLLYIPVESKKVAIDMVNKDDFDVRYSNELWNLADYYNNIVPMYPEDKPTKESIMRDTVPTIK